jgi:hypothetical protein
MREDDGLSSELAVAAATATFQNLSIIGALAERHLIDQAKVADWLNSLPVSWKTARKAPLPIWSTCGK